MQRSQWTGSQSRKSETMMRKYLLSICLFSSLIVGCEIGVEAQESPDLHVVVNLVQLNVAVTDKKGNYITGLRPKDFSIVEDRIVEKIATFAEGNEPALSLIEPTETKESSGPSNELKGPSAGDAPRTLDSLLVVSNVFVFFNTSNY